MVFCFSCKVITPLSYIKSLEKSHDRKLVKIEIEINKYTIINLSPKRPPYQQGRKLQSIQLKGRNGEDGIISSRTKIYLMYYHDMTVSAFYQLNYVFSGLNAPLSIVPT